MKILIRLVGMILSLSLCMIMIIPFLLLFILLGIDKANVIMSTVMRVPMNMTFGDNMGDFLLQSHKDIIINSNGNE